MEIKIPIQEVRTVSDMARILGAKGGRVKSDAKTLANRANAKKPRKKKPSKIFFPFA